jgi:hypothetical protein
MGTMKYHMGYTPDDASTRVGIRFKKDKDRVAVIPAFTAEGDLAAFIWPRHYLGQGAKPAYATCGKLYGPDAPCPLCAKGMKQDWRASVTVLDVATGDRRFLDGINMAGFRAMETAVKVLRENGGDPCATVFVITRSDGNVKGQLSVVTVAAKPDAAAVAASMVPFTPEEMVEESTPSAPPRDDTPPPDDADLPF